MMIHLARHDTRAISNPTRVTELPPIRQRVRDRMMEHGSAICVLHTAALFCKACCRDTQLVFTLFP
ncbi:hypothetical protein ACSW3V_07855 [Acetobacter indonesiensis]